MRLFPALALAALAAGCTQADPAATTTPPPPAGELPFGSPPAQPHADTFVTRIAVGAYEHPRLDAATQATIVWVNEDAPAHSVVSDDGRFAGSGPIAHGSEFRYTFLTPGDYAYHCRYHPDTMRGIVVVR